MLTHHGAENSKLKIMTELLTAGAKVRNFSLPRKRPAVFPDIFFRMPLYAEKPYAHARGFC